MNKRSMKLAALALFLLIGVEARGQIDPSQHYRIMANHSRKCLDVEGGPRSVADGVPVQQWECNNWDNQKWQFVPVGEDYYRIVAAHSGKSLDVTGGAGATANGALVQQWEWVSGDNQKWRLIPAGEGLYHIVAKHSGKVLDVTGGTRAIANGVRAQQWENVGGDNQKWSLTPVGRVEPVASRVSARFRITLNGFTCGHPTADHNLQADGVDDEVYIRAQSVFFDGRTFVEQPEARTLIIGDTNNQTGRIRGGSGHNIFGGNGGFKAGDSFPGRPAWARTSPPINDRPPLLVWEGELTSGANGIVVIPSLWESDNNELLFVSQWANSIDFVHAMAREMNSLFTDPSGRYVHHPSPPPAVAGSVARWRGRWGDAQNRIEETYKRNVSAPHIRDNTEDRPVGMRRFGETFDFRPRVFVMNYEIADYLARTNTFFGEGVIQIHYVEEDPPAGYILYMQIERLP